MLFGPAATSRLKSCERSSNNAPKASLSPAGVVWSSEKRTATCSKSMADAVDPLYTSPAKKKTSLATLSTKRPARSGEKRFGQVSRCACSRIDSGLTLSLPLPVWSKRFPLYEECCTHTYYSLTAKRDVHEPSLVLKDVERDFTRFVRRVLSSTPEPLPDNRRRSYVISLANLDPKTLTRKLLENATHGVDAIELRVDTLKAKTALGSPFNSPFGTPNLNPGFHDVSYVAFAVAQIRNLSPLPIIYTVRTIRQNGSYVLDESSRQSYITLLISAIKMGVEYIDLEIDLGPELITEIMQHRSHTTRVILSHVDYSHRLQWQQAEVLQLYEHAVSLGADIVKLSLYAATPADNQKLADFIHHVERSGGDDESSPRVPVIALNTGKAGEASARFNHLFTPVSHPSLRSLNSLGILHFPALQRSLLNSGAEALKYVAIARNGSGRMHRRQVWLRAVDMLGLPVEITDEDDAVDREQLSAALLDAKVHDKLDSIGLSSPSAIWTGHIDTAFRDPHTNTLTYHNIRSVAMAAFIQTRLAPINAITEVTTAILIGAKDAYGKETAFALLESGVRHVVCVDSDTSMPEDGRIVHLTTPEQLSSRQYPTLVLTFTDPTKTVIPVTSLLSSPTGGTILTLGDAASSVGWKECLQSNGLSHAWVHSNHHDIEMATIREQFQLITGYRLPEAALKDTVID